MSLVTLDEFRGAVQETGPMFNWMWSVDSFPTIDGVDLPRSYCLQVNLPFSKISQDDLQVAATTIYFAGYSQISGFNMELFEDAKLSSIAYIQRWMDLIQNPLTGGYRLPSQYKKDITVGLYNTKGEKVGTSLIKNAWPLGLQDLDLQGNGQDPIRHSVEFACDAQILKLET